MFQDLHEDIIGTIVTFLPVCDVLAVRLAMRLPAWCDPVDKYRHFRYRSQPESVSIEMARLGFPEHMIDPKHMRTCAKVAMHYASPAYHFIDERWPEAEPAILKNSCIAGLYAVNNIRKRWYEAESIIVTNGLGAANYAAFILFARWPEAEPIIMTCPEAICIYAVYLLERRWPEAEQVLLESPYHTFVYLMNLVTERWPEAEPNILTCSKYIVWYSCNILEKRWLEAEKHIIDGPQDECDEYCTHFSIEKNDLNMCTSIVEYIL
jgi:hypothetical protein